MKTTLGGDSAIIDENPCLTLCVDRKKTIDVINTKIETHLQLYL